MAHDNIADGVRSVVVMPAVDEPSTVLQEAPAPDSPEALRDLQDDVILTLFKESLIFVRTLQLAPITVINEISRSDLLPAEKKRLAVYEEELLRRLTLGQQMTELVATMRSKIENVRVRLSGRAARMPLTMTSPPDAKDGNS